MSALNTTGHPVRFLSVPVPQAVRTVFRRDGSALAPGTARKGHPEKWSGRRSQPRAFRSSASQV